MPGEMLTTDELDQMDDLSSAALYRAEVKHIPFIPREEQPAYIEAARSNDETAQHDLILNCLNWTMRRAAAICRDYQPSHSDVMDLVGHANLKMVEAMPKALTADDPVAYFMSVSAHEMHRYCRYNDPLIRYSKDWPSDVPRPGTLSLEAREVTLPTHEVSPGLPKEYRIVYDALAKLAPRHRTVLTAAYGLNG